MNSFETKMLRATVVALVEALPIFGTVTTSGNPKHLTTSQSSVVQNHARAYVKAALMALRDVARAASGAAVPTNEDYFIALWTAGLKNALRTRRVLESFSPENDKDITEIASVVAGLALELEDHLPAGG